MRKANPKTDFNDNSELGQLIFEFWRSLNDDHGTRAMLQRCRHPDDVVGVPAYHRLCLRVRPLVEGDYHWQQRIAAVAGLLAGVRKAAEKDSPRIAERMGRVKGDRPIVSELRFRRLLKTQESDANAFYPALRRVIVMLDGKADPLDIARTVYFWDDRYRGPGIRREWAFDYFSNLPARKAG